MKAQLSGAATVALILLTSHTSLGAETPTGDRLESNSPEPPTSGEFDPEPARREPTQVARKGYWPVPGTPLELKIGGYAKLDAIYDFNEIGNRNKFATNSIGVPTREHARFTLHPFETRLNVDVRGPLGKTDTQVFVEVDFFGDGGGGLQLRHAYGVFGPLLAGQTWTTYMDLSSRPHTLDFEGPDAELFVRQPMIRVTHEVLPAVAVQVAAEYAQQDLGVGDGLGGSPRVVMPDFTANVRWEGEVGHAQASGLVRRLELEGDPGTPSGDAVGWGVALSGQLNLGDPSRRLMGQGSTGQGSAYYNQALRGTDSDAFLSSRGTLEPLLIVTAVAGYEQDWSKHWTSTFAYSIAWVDNLEEQPTDAIHQSQSASANLVWHPFERFLTGVEYLFGYRKDRDEDDGWANRLMLSFKFLI